MTGWKRLSEPHLSQYTDDTHPVSSHRCQCSSPLASIGFNIFPHPWHHLSYLLHNGMQFINKQNDLLPSLFFTSSRTAFRHLQILLCIFAPATRLPYQCKDRLIFQSYPTSPLTIAVPALLRLPFYRPQALRSEWSCSLSYATGSDRISNLFVTSMTGSASDLLPLHQMSIFVQCIISRFGLSLVTL